MTTTSENPTTNVVNTVNTVNTELEHDDGRSDPARAVTPSHADTQRAVDLTNAIQRDLFARLDQVDAKHGPATSHRLGLHRHIVAVLADHRDRIASSGVAPTSPTTRKHVELACNLVNSIERNLVGRLADIESTLQPAAVERLRLHVITALGDHIEQLANMLAASDKP